MNINVRCNSVNEQMFSGGELKYRTLYRRVCVIREYAIRLNEAWVLIIDVNTGSLYLDPVMSSSKYVLAPEKTEVVISN